MRLADGETMVALARLQQHNALMIWKWMGERNKKKAAGGV